MLYKKNKENKIKKKKKKKKWLYKIKSKNLDN